MPKPFSKPSRPGVKSGAKPAHALMVNKPAFKLDLPDADGTLAVSETIALHGVAFDERKPFNVAAQIMGDSASTEALRILNEQTAHIKKFETLTLLREALVRFKAADWSGGGQLALKALHVDEKCGEAWHILAIAREKCADLPTALTCYETALRLTPDNPYIANDLGRLSYRLGILDMAQKFFLFFLERMPSHGEAINNLASVLREESKFEEAIEILRLAINNTPNDPQLWNALGTVVNGQGDVDNATIFYREALRHDPNNCHALYNLAGLVSFTEHPSVALELHMKALPKFADPENAHTCRLAIAFCYMHMRDYENAWKWYAARNEDQTIDKIYYLIDRPRWTLGDHLRGKRIFVSAEQGLGDEVMFATILPELIEEVGPEGHVSIGVESRLVPLFQRSFPNCTVFRHHTTKHHTKTVRIFPDVTNWSDYDYYGIMGDFLARYRRRPEDFDGTRAFLTPDPERIAHWKGVLNALNDKPKIGVLWKSAVKHARRDRYYSPFEQWKDVLSVEGVQIVNLQYGDTSQELAEAEAMGLDIWTPPGIDLKKDLDDLSALCAALDCVMGPANATSNIAGAAGTLVWMMTPRHSWNCMGLDRWPWYPSSRIFLTSNLSDWSAPMTEMRNALIETFVGKAPKAQVA
ncbi:MULTISPECIES: tetratricopeptide repeat protein [Asticcacaulis]|uniref:tetratricopeptide repeat protein n=1 Tax=Asticcacaulis TaxID=76890 RepID=UPI001FD911FE|nr:MULTISPECIES: tetratricopeptide repeat protein [Asticcacaulis]MBP2158921.1 tetratricopeptide (TPR) repeat protein [Asticcacaulis solisilvae]MDR6799966.1 tetratricopeptide (TPR) repeat protein [Asticcacaulis sp. BE141]